MSADIRVRNADPKLLAEFEKIAQDVKANTHAGTIEKMIPRYWDFKKRVEEQNQEIAKLTRELRTVQFRNSELESNFDRFNDYVKDWLTTAQRVRKGRAKTKPGKPGKPAGLAKKRPATKSPAKKKKQ